MYQSSVVSAYQIFSDGYDFIMYLRSPYSQPGRLKTSNQLYQKTLVLLQYLISI